MKIRYNYSTMAVETLLSLKPRLEEGAWGSVQAVTLDALTAKTAFEVTAKTLMLTQIDALLSALAIDNVRLKELDEQWDRAQRRLMLSLAISQNGEDKALREQANLFARELLAGEGAAQVRWSYQREVDWGSAQIERLKQPAFEQHIDALGLRQVIQDIASTTQALAEGIGRSAESAAKEAPSRYIARVRHELTVGLDSITGQLDCLIAITPDGSAKERFVALRAPLLALHDIPR